ncbi:MAG: dipicolinate synthase [Clostridia bacterium]|nr:dipicolinate synthase [Clostridia bacterium]
MKENIKIGIVGGDARQLAAAHALACDGFRVSCFGVPKTQGRYKGFKICNNLEDAVAGCDAVLLGVPYSPDGKWLNCPPGEYAVSVKALLDTMTPGQLLLGGRFDDTLYENARKYCIKAIDYFTSEELTVLNAIPTAQGAVEIAMKELDFTLRDARILITGFGRVAKVLAHTLKGLGCEVCICCRRKSESAWCRVYGYSFCPLEELYGHIDEYDVIFNTVPSVIFTMELLYKTDALIIDLASAPGGVDTDAAENSCTRVIHALSLPGKIAPKTAGEIIAGSVCDILKEEGVL